MLRPGLAAILSVLAAALVAAQAALPKTAGPLEGTWVIASVNGQPPPAGATEMALRFAGGTYAQLVSGKAVEEGTTRITSSATIISVDLTIGGTGPSAGKVQLGRCALKAGELTCKLNAAGAPQRPADLAPERGLFQFVAKKR